MTTDRDFDRITAAWLDLMPDMAPDRVVASILEDVALTPQARRPIVRVPWVSPRTDRMILIAATVLLAAALLGGALLVGGGSRGGLIVSPTPSLEATEAPPPTPLAILPGEPWVLYERFVQLGGGLFVMRPDGSNDHQLTNFPSGVLKEADWSPDGTKVAFVDDVTGLVWIAGIDGSQPQAIPCSTGCGRPAWSPDGTRIAYSLAEAGNNGPAAVSIRVYDPASGLGSIVLRLARPLLADVPRWSPDGTQLVFGVDRMDEAGAETGSAIAVVPITGGEPRYLTGFDKFAYQPDWRSTGDDIVFSTQTIEARAAPQPGDAWDLYLVRADGTGLRQLTHVGAGVRLWFPSWTPDGKRIIASDQVSRTAQFIDPTTGALEAIGGTDLAAARLRPTP